MSNIKKDLYRLMIESIKNGEYLHVGTVQGIDYYMPNDEERGSIVAVKHKSQLVKATGFYDMGDFFDGSDYAFIEHNGRLVPAFEILYNQSRG